MHIDNIINMRYFEFRRENVIERRSAHQWRTCAIIRKYHDNIRRCYIIRGARTDIGGYKLLIRARVIINLRSDHRRREALSLWTPRRI